jgi:diguanylate cyclase (GGDEF)-like protein
LLDDRGRNVDDPLEAPTRSRVLLIESDPHAALLIGEMLRVGWSESLVVLHAERLADATQELLDHSATCVLLDLPLADSERLPSVEQIRTAAPDVPIVALSDYEDEDDALRAIRAGAQDYVVKTTLSPALLRRAIAYAVARKQAEVQLVHEALHDPLTGLPNRALFLDRLGVALDRSRRTNASLAVMFLDVDNFKQVNDSLGHAAGDRLLTELAGRLRAMLRPMDTMARFGGDEFTFLFEELASEREVVLIAERVIESARVPIALGGSPTTITVSIGIALVTDPRVEPEAVIREADAAMYRAKEHGPSRFELFDKVSGRRAMERLELETELRLAVDRSELQVYYQPSMSLSDGLVGLEALVRWDHPERGLLAPDDFLKLAEETGLMPAIGRYVLEHAVGQLARLRRRKPGATISVNVSLGQLEDVSLPSMLAGVIRAREVEPSALCIEIAESAVTQAPETVLRALNGLRAVGVRLAIDDFGTGASSLSMLERLPVDAIKVHESFISGLGTDPDQLRIVGAVIQLGHALGLTVIAEGVEAEPQRAALRELGCDAAQGYLLGRPVPEQDLKALLASADFDSSGP